MAHPSLLDSTLEAKLEKIVRTFVFPPTAAYAYIELEKDSAIIMNELLQKRGYIVISQRLKNNTYELTFRPSKILR